MRLMILALPMFLFGSVTHANGGAYEQAPLAPTFEVISIKENVSGGERASRRSLPNGRLVISNMTLEQLIAFAYGVGGSSDQFRITGGPAGILSKRFDITATPPAGSSASEHPLMMRSLLAERFKLRTHTEKREVQVYALTVAREGKLGPTLRPSALDCTAWAISAGGKRDDQPRDTQKRPLCTIINLPGGVTRRDAGPMLTLVRWARANLRDRPIVDMTRLTGNYEWEVTFSHEVTSPSPDSMFPSIFTAFTEQLGLRLQPRLSPIEGLVIDSVSMPTPD